VSCYLFTVMAICHSVPRRNTLKKVSMDRFKCCGSIFAVINKLSSFTKVFLMNCVIAKHSLHFP